jgi:radical SAM superfamily enzyme YgiQ (UPF0313 family)
MRILLTTLNAKYIHSNPALKYLYSVSVGSGFDIRLKEYTINQNKGMIFDEIVRLNPDLLCFSCYIWNIGEILEISRDLAKALPDMKILLGGPEVSFQRDKLMEAEPQVDFIIRGEGEIPFYKLCKEIFMGKGKIPTSCEVLKEIPSLTFRSDGGEIMESPGCDPVPLDMIPFPYRDLELEKDKIIYYESSRGCPYRCSYCLSSIDKSLRFRSIEKTERDLRYFLANGVKQVKFIDRTFNSDEERAYKLWSFLNENDNGVTNFHFEICPDIISERQMSLLKKIRPGQFQFEAGIQTTNRGSLEKIGRHVDKEKAFFNIKEIMSFSNIHMHLDLIAGLPLEDMKSFKKSFNEVYELKPHMLQLGFLKLLKGTRIYEESKEFSYVYRERAPYEVISSGWMSAEELVRLREMADIVDLYYNRSGYEKTLAFFCEYIYGDSFDFYRNFSDFYASHGYRENRHSKADLYRIFYQFAEEVLEGDALYEAERLLKYDIYQSMTFESAENFFKKGWTIDGKRQGKGVSSPNN